MTHKGKTKRERNANDDKKCKELFVASKRTTPQNVRNAWSWKKSEEFRYSFGSHNFCFRCCYWCRYAASLCRSTVIHYMTKARPHFFDHHQSFRKLIEARTASDWNRTNWFLWTYWFLFLVVFSVWFLVQLHWITGSIEWKDAVFSWKLKLQQNVWFFIEGASHCQKKRNEIHKHV